VPIVLKYGSLNLLELNGPVQACNGMALPLHLPFSVVDCKQFFLMFIGSKRTDDLVDMMHIDFVRSLRKQVFKICL
jgi:hypothetical protein